MIEKIECPWCGTVIKHTKQEPCEDAISREAAITIASLHTLTVDESVEAIKRLPSVQPKPIECKDAISREDATAEFIKWQSEVAYAFGRDYLGVRIIQSAIDTIRQLPSVQPSRKGHWINDKDDMPTCSECGYIPPYSVAIDDYEYSNYCPSCGADMRGDTDADSN